MSLTKNLGLVKAIFVGLIPPNNTQMLWYDDNNEVKKHKYYNTITSTWTELISGITANQGNIIYISTGGSVDGIKGSLYAPFTPDAAKEIAIPGDNICWLAGVYEPTQNMFVDGVTHSTLGCVVLNPVGNIDLFDFSAATLDVNIKGQFIVNASSTGKIFKYSGSAAIKYSIDIILGENTDGDCLGITNSNILSFFNFNGTLISYAGVALDIAGTNSIIKGRFKSTASNAIKSTSGQTVVHLIDAFCESSTSATLYSEHSLGGSIVYNGNVNNTTVGNDVIYNANGIINFTGNVNGYIRNISGCMTLNFLPNNLYNYWYINNAAQMVINGNGFQQQGLITQSSANSYCELNGIFEMLTINVSNGKFIDNSIPKSTGYGSIIDLSGGEYHHRGVILSANVSVNHTGGDLFCEGRMKNTSNSVNGNCINWNGSGSISIKGCTFITTHSEAMAIHLTNTIADILIHHGSTNKIDTITAKKRKQSVVITGGAVTSTININGTDYTSALSTSALRAADIYAQINADIPLPVTASDLSGSNFNIEADVAGTDFTHTTGTELNVSYSDLRQNSFAMSDVLGSIVAGRFIENVLVI